MNKKHLGRLFKPNESLFNILLKFQMLISEIFQYFLSKKCKELLQELTS